MAVDFDLSYFRLVKSFAAVEISRNVGAPAADEQPDQPARAEARPMADPSPARESARDPAKSANRSTPITSKLPDNLSDDMRAALDEGLEGAERDAVGWGHGQRQAALSLAGLSRPLAMRDGAGSARDQQQEIFAEQSTSEPDHASNRLDLLAQGAKPITTDSPAWQRIRSNEVAGATDSSSVQDDASFPGGAPTQGGSTAGGQARGSRLEPESRFGQFDEAGPAVAAQKETAARPLVPLTSANVSHSTEAAATEAANPGDEEGGSGKAQPRAATPLHPHASTDAVPLEAGISAGDNSAGRRPHQAQSLPAFALTLFGETEMADALQSLVAAQEPDTSAVTRGLSARGLSTPPADAVSFNQSGDSAVDLGRAKENSQLQRRLLSEVQPAAREMGTVASGADLETSVFNASSLAAAQEGDVVPPASASVPASAQAAMASPALLTGQAKEILDALMALTVATGDAAEDLQPLSSIILNAAMIPGWPPPRPLENPALLKQADLLAKPLQTEVSDEGKMTPEQLIAYLLSVGANARLLKALQDLFRRVEKKNGAALLAWLSGLVSALKEIEKSLKDMVEDGVELPDWLKELVQTSNRGRRRRQFHI